MQINLNDDLTKKLEERVNASDEFDSVEAYVNYVLEEVIKQTGNEPAAEPTYTKEQEEAVKKRLEDLGYLD
ncbi:MAG: CopG family transcriptional regulator [Candidatus Kerfeldbacteria bacterium]